MPAASRSRFLMSAGAALLLVPLATAGPARADQVKLNVALGHPVLRADTKQLTYLKVGLTGFRLERETDRAPVNLAIVIDTSGSMQGEKIEKAREAAIMAIRRLTRRDIVSVVEYSDTVRVIVPATKLTDTEAVCAAIRRLQATSGTALFAGLSKGAEEARKFLDRGRVNRVVLLSDGLANIGPSSPAELGELGSSLIKEGISVTTIGLGTGYNEDLMSRLAEKSDGNHHFVENSADLSRIFNSELGDVLTVVGQEVAVKIQCAEGIRPIRVLGREADITGQRVVAALNQIYSEQEKYVLLEIEVPATPSGRTMQVAQVEVSYANMQTKTTDVLRSEISTRFSDSAEIVEKEANKQVLVSAVEQIASINNFLAMKLRDAGKIEEARAALLRNAEYLLGNATRYKSDALERSVRVQKENADNLDGAKYPRARKVMVEEQYKVKNQQKQE